MPFRYPLARHERRHGPQGYAHYASFRPWLRDEFSFRCVYCLYREQWGRVMRAFDIDHFIPVAIDPTKETEYDNLLYACAPCNAAKSDRRIPNPCETLLAADVIVHDDGRIEGVTADAHRIILVLGLNSPETIEFRRLQIDIVALASQHDPELYRRLMQFPDDLPDLARLQPPQGNSRPEGVDLCCFEQRARGELPAVC